MTFQNALKGEQDYWGCLKATEADGWVPEFPPHISQYGRLVKGMDGRAKFAGCDSG